MSSIGMGEVLIAVTALALVIGFRMLALYFRHRHYQMYHQERLAAIEKNLQLPDSFFEVPSTQRTPSGLLLRGLIWLFAGIGLAVLFVAMFFAQPGEPEFLGVATIGLIPAGVGIAYLVVYRIERKKEEEATTKGESSPEVSLRQ